MAIRELSPTFEEILKRIVENHKNSTDVLRGKDGGRLHELNRGEDPGPNRFIPKEFNSVFDRTSLIKDYVNARKFVSSDSEENGTVSDVMLVCRQQDFLSGLQRDYMSRKLGRIQAIGLDVAVSKREGSEATSNLEKAVHRPVKRLANLTGGR